MMMSENYYQLFYFLVPHLGAILCHLVPRTRPNFGLKHVHWPYLKRQAYNNQRKNRYFQIFEVPPLIWCLRMTLLASNVACCTIEYRVLTLPNKYASSVVCKGKSICHLELFWCNDVHFWCILRQQILKVPQQVSEKCRNVHKIMKDSSYEVQKESKSEVLSTVRYYAIL